MDERQLATAVIGCGRIGVRHAEVYRRHGRSKLVAVCDVDRVRAEAAAAAFGVNAYDSVEEMLKNENLDLVTVATTWNQHYEPTVKAIDAGLHVLCEKPLSHNTVEARDMVRRARDRGVKLGVNFNYRFAYTTQKAQELIRLGKLGKICFLNFQLIIFNPDDFTPYYHLIALHTHSFDFMRYFGGEVSRLQALLVRPSGRPSYTTSVINLEFEEGSVGSLIGSYDMANNQSIMRFEAGGTAGRLVIDNVTEGLSYYPHDVQHFSAQTWQKHIFDRTDYWSTFDARIEQFITDILQELPVNASGEDGLRSMELVEAAIRSFEEGRVIDVKGDREHAKG